MRNLVKTVQKNEQKIGGEVPETGINKGNIGVSQEGGIFDLISRKKYKNRAYGNGVIMEGWLFTICLVLEHLLVVHCIKKCKYT